MEYIYNVKEKENCWYKDICRKERCGDEFCIRHYKMDSLIFMATMEGKQKYSVQLKPDAIDYDAFIKLRDIKNNIKDFVKEGKNLLIYSKNTGNGKTEWSKKLLLSWFDSIWPYTDVECRGLFISMPKLITCMKENISKPNEYFQYVNDNLVNADLVVWDEINYKDWSSFEQDFMLNIISQRVAIGKANIYTTNYDLQAIEQRLGSRLSSRIIGCSELVELKGSDKRGLGV